MELAIITLWGDLTYHDPIAIVILFPEDGAILFIDRLGRIRRVCNELCHLPECLSDERGAPIVADRGFCSVNTPPWNCIWHRVVCVGQPNVLRIGLVFIVFEDLVDGLTVFVSL